MKNIAIIPARSGSKGLPDKNIKVLNNKPLMVYTINSAIESKMFDEIMVSTDSNEYAKIAFDNGASVPFFRSVEQSGDMASSWGVVVEVLTNYAKMGLYFDTVCLLQPTSPLRLANDIIKAYDLLQEKQANAVTSMCEVDHSPLWSTKLAEDLSLSEFRKRTNSNIPRQKLEKYYRINGAIYIRRIKYVDNRIVIIDDDEYAYLMPKDRSIDIDDELDFLIAEILINRT